MEPLNRPTATSTKTRHRDYQDQNAPPDHRKTMLKDKRSAMSRGGRDPSKGRELNPKPNLTWQCRQFGERDRQTKERNQGLRDELHKEEPQKAKAEFGAALTEVRHELQNLTDRPPTPQCHSEACAQNGHDEILRKIQSLREAIGPCVPTGSPSYADVARTPPLSHPSNIRTLSTLNTNPTTPTDTLYCTIDTSKLAETENERTSAGSIRAAVETEIRVTEDHSHWRCRAVTVDPKNTNRIRIACRDEAEHQLV